MSVGGNSEPFDIAEAFRNFYSNVYLDSSADTAAMGHGLLLLII